MVETRFVVVEPRPYPLRRESGEVVQTTLLGLYRKVPEGGLGRDNEVVDRLVQLEDGEETKISDLMQRWGETHLGLPPDQDD